MLGGKILMNKFLRVLGLGLMIATFAFAGFAQEPTRETVYAKYTENFQGPEVTKLQVALDAAKEYVAKFNTPDDKAQVDYFNEAIPTLEQAIAKMKEGVKAQEESKQWYALLGDFAKNVNGKNWAQAYSTGKQALDKQFTYLDNGPLTSETVKGQKLDIAIILGVMGFDRAAEKNDTFNNESLTYLRQAVQQIESGQSTKNFGLLDGYVLKDKDNALGLLNYYIGYIMYYRQKKEQEALPYFYKATQSKSASQDISDIYRAIGFNYYDRIAQLDKDRLAKIAANNNADNDETLALLAQEKGIADRGIDAYARALKVAMANPKTTQEYKDGLRSSLEEIYKFRYDKTDGLDAYLNTVTNKPFVNPTTPIQPVVEEKKVETTTTTTSPNTSSTKPPTQVTTKTTEIKTTPMANGTKTTVKTTTTTEAKPTNPKKPRRR